MINRGDVRFRTCETKSCQFANGPNCRRDMQTIRSTHGRKCRFILRISILMKSRIITILNVSSATDARPNNEVSAGEAVSLQIGDLHHEAKRFAWSGS